MSEIGPKEPNAGRENETGDESIGARSRMTAAQASERGESATGVAVSPPGSQGATRGPVSPRYRHRNTDMPDQVFERAPLGHVDGIPLFSVADRFVENYEAIARDHIESLVATGENKFMTDRLMVELEESTRGLVRKYGRPGDMLLDVGVGLGRLLAPLEGFHRFGMDITMDYLKRARDEGINVAYARIEDMPYRSELFDVIVTTDVLEHVLDLNYCTDQILRVLKTGGVLIVRVPHNDLLEAYVDTPGPYELVHLRKFDVPSLRLHFEKIFNCTFVEALPVSPYFKGTPTLRLRSLPHTSYARELIGGIPDEHPAAFLKPFLGIDHDVLVNQFAELQKTAPDFYGLLAPELLEPLEINVVFIKRG